jgi:hypothetical protein
LELGERGQHPEHCPPFHGGDVDALLNGVQSDAALAQVGAEGYQVQHGTGEPAESGDLPAVALARQLDVELRAGTLFSRCSRCRHGRGPAGGLARTRIQPPPSAISSMTGDDKPKNIKYSPDNRHNARIIVTHPDAPSPPEVRQSR